MPPHQPCPGGAQPGFGEQREKSRGLEQGSWAWMAAVVGSVTGLVLEEQDGLCGCRSSAPSLSQSSALCSELELPTPPKGGMRPSSP